MASTPATVSPPAPAADGKETDEMVAPEMTPLSSLLTPHLVAIFVGPKRKAFHLHRDLLCDRSPYFKAAFTGNFKEAETKELFLPEDDDAAFELFVNWLYGSALEGPRNEDGLRPYLALLALSEKLMVEYLNNRCLDLIKDYYRDSKAIVRAQDIEFVYDKVQSVEKRRFLSLLAAVQTVERKSCDMPADIQQLVADGGSFSTDFSGYLLQIAQKSGTEADKFRPTSGLVCGRYHSHKDTPKCKTPSCEPLNANEAIFTAFLSNKHRQQYLSRRYRT